VHRSLSFALELATVEKKEQYKESEVVLAHFARTLGHPARAAILTALVDKGGMVEGEIIAVPALSQATVIQHLRELKRAGFIQGRIFGAKARYHIDWETIQKLDSQVSAFLHMMRIGREQSHES
jgi:predicted transcriptional regulator